jgi:O-antigen/teichoic acid export membrane protein
MTAREAAGESGKEAPAAESPPPQAAAGIGRNAFFALAAQVTTGLFTTVLTLYLVRALGPDRYGVFALALGVGVIATIVSDFGIPQSASRYLAENRDDKHAVVALLRDALRLKLATAAIATGALFAAAGPIADAYNEPALRWPLRGIAVSLFAESVLLLYVTALIGLARVAISLRVIFLESAAETVASITLVALGAGATGAAFGRASGYAFGAVAAMVIVARLYGRSAVGPLGRGSGRTGEIARYSAPLFITNSTFTLYAQIDVIIIGVILGTTAVGLFSAPVRLAVPLAYVGQALANSVSPRQASKGRGPRSVAAFQLSLRWLIIFQAVLLAPLMVWAGPIVRLLLGPSFSESANVLRALSLYIFLDGPSRLISTTVNYLGLAKQRIPIVLTALAVTVTLDLTLLPRIGVVGAAIGTGTALAIAYVPGHIRICHRVLDFDLRLLAVTLVRAVVSAMAMGLVLFAVGTHSLSLGQLVLGGAAGILVFLVTLLLTHEVTMSELRHGWRIATEKRLRMLPGQRL